MKLTRLAKGRRCVRCGRENGTTCAAHYQGAQSGRLGKGMGIKPDDLFCAWLCDHCHNETDGRQESLYSREELDHQMAMDVLVTIGLLVDEGYITINYSGVPEA